MIGTAQQAGEAISAGINALYHLVSSGRVDANSDGVDAGATEVLEALEAMTAALEAGLRHEYWSSHAIDPHCLEHLLAVRRELQNGPLSCEGTMLAREILRSFGVEVPRTGVADGEE